MTPRGDADSSGRARVCPDCDGAKSYQASRCRGCAAAYRIAHPDDEATLQQRFWRQVDKTEHCWLWTGTVNADGYGRVRQHGRNDGPHRVAYRWLVGPIPDGLQLDHLCRTPSCVNPAHLEAVTSGENTRRSVPFRAFPTACPRGHAYSESNTYRNRSGHRHCRACHRASEARRRMAVAS